MREGLRSSSLKERGKKVNSGFVDGVLGTVMIPDLNVKEDADVVLSDENRIDGSLCRVRVLGSELLSGVDEGGNVGDDEQQKIVMKENDVDEGLSSRVLVMSGGGDECDRVIESKEVFTEEMGGVGGSECKFDEGSVVGVGKVLRSRIVPASGNGRKRKRETGGKEEVGGMSKGGNDESTVDSENVCIDDSPVKWFDHFEEETVPTNVAPVVSKVVVEDANRSAIIGLKKKGRGRPRKYVDGPAEAVVQTRKVEVKFDVGVGNLSSKLVRKIIVKRKRGRPRKWIDQPVEDGIQMNKVIGDEDLTVRSVRGLKKKRKRGRPRKYFPVDEVVGQEVEEAAGSSSSKSIQKSKKGHKRGRPKKSVDLPEEQIVQTKKVPFCDVEDGVKDENENENEDEDGVARNKLVRSLKKKGKRGRPRKQDGNDAVKVISYKKGKMINGRKMKMSLVTAPVRKKRHDTRPRRIPEVADDGLRSKKRILSHEKIKSCKPQTKGGSTSFKGEVTPMRENNLPLKRKRVKTVGSVTAEKNLIRKRIVDMLLAVGWRIDYRPRVGREYNDAVYVSPEGKGYWSVTKAYKILKEAVEKGEVGSGAGNSDFCFSPIPEEVLSKLFRVVSKTRSDKNKKKNHKNDNGDSSDNELIRDKSESGARGRKSVKKKSSARDGTQSKRRSALLVRSNKGLSSKGDGVIAYAGKHSVLAWMIDSGVVCLEGKVQYMNRDETKSMLEGSVTRDGIRCSCCNQVFSVSEFESHTGSKLGEPYENVYLDSGHSLLRCQLDAWNKQEEKGRTGYHSVPVDGDDSNDDTCGICGDGGNLVCCDGCPSIFHHDCLDIKEVPSGEWHCVYCSCKFCGVGESASGRDDDCDTTPSLMTCRLCNRKYHQSCIYEVDAVCAGSNHPTFCGQNCKQIFDRLQSILGAKHDLDDGFSWTLLQRSDVEADAVALHPQKILCNSKLAVALSVMDECFVPIIDPRSGINLIRHIVYSCGSNFNRLNFSNFFTVVLERGEEVICAASVRIHGKGLAEMPFIGTRNVYRRQKMCRRLLSAIELALGSLDVEKLVIPAIPELIYTWTSAFGFKPLDESVKGEMRSTSMLVFPRTGMLHKLLLKQQEVQKNAAVIDENVQCHESQNDNLVVEADKSEVDNGSLHGTFDLNCAAPDLPESSTDERMVVSPRSTAGNCEDEVTCANKLDGQKSLKENENDQAMACVLPLSSEGKTLKPDLNLMEEHLFEDSGKTNFPEKDKSQLHHCSASVNSDEIEKSTRDSSKLTNNVGGSSLLDNASKSTELPKSEGDFIGNIVTLATQGDDNGFEVATCNDVHRFPGDETRNPSSLMGSIQSQVGCSNIVTNDKETVVLGDVACPNVELVSECEFHDTKEEFSCDETVPTKSTDSPVECTSHAHITSDTLCSMSPSHFRGNSIRKVGSET